MSELITRQEQLILEQKQQIALLAQYVTQFGTAMMAIEARLKAIERQSAAATLSHAQVLAVQRRIRTRSAALSDRYRLTEKPQKAAMRSAIQKDVLRAQGVKNLHDVPLRAMADVERQIDGYTGYEQARNIRDKGRKTHDSPDTP